MKAAKGYELEGLYIDASYAPLTTENNRVNTNQGVNLKASSDVVLDVVELVNRRTDDRSGTCMFGGTSFRAKIVDSWVHKCGEIDPVTNREHGVYVADSTGMLIKDTWISDTADRGIQYYDKGHGALTVGVLIDSVEHSNTGVVWNGDTKDSVVRNSVVRVGQDDRTLNAGGVYSGGPGNRAENNCLSSTPAEFGGSNVAESGDIVVANPKIVGFAVTNPQCYAKLPADSPFRP
jgi:hypothetical protein